MKTTADAQHNVRRQLRWKLFDQASLTSNTEPEKRKREGILALLYAKTLSNPENSPSNHVNRLQLSEPAHSV